MKNNLSKTQKEIEELASQVPALTSRQEEWATMNYSYFKWVKSTDTHFACPNCKGDNQIVAKKKKDTRHNAIDREVRCPHCGARINIRSYNDVSGYNPKHRPTAPLQQSFFQVMNVVGDWQVTRLFYMSRYCYTRKDNTKWFFYECCQAWNIPSSKNTYFRALPKKVMPGWSFNPYSLYHWDYEQNPDTWGVSAYRNYRNELEARKVNGANYFYTQNVCPYAQILPKYKLVGLIPGAFNNSGIDAMGWFQSYAKGEILPMYETLLKAKEYKLLDRITSRPSDKRETYFKAWKI